MYDNIFINNYPLVTAFKNKLMDDILQLGIDHIFSATFHPKNNGKPEVFHKYLKSSLKKLCENGQNNWDQYLNQVLASYCVTPHLPTGETPFFLIYGRDPNLPLHQLLEPMQCFLGNPDSGKNRFRNAQKTTDCPAPDFQVGDRVCFKINYLANRT